MGKNNIIEKEVNPRDALVSLVKFTKTGAKLFSDTSVTFEHSAESLTFKFTAGQTIKLLALTNLLL